MSTNVIKLFILLSTTLLLASLPGCKSSAECTATLENSHAKTKCEIKASIEFKGQTWPDKFDQVLVVELSKDYELSTKEVLLETRVTTDRGSNKQGRFRFIRSPLKLKPMLRDTVVYAFIPAEKSRLDAFFKDSLGKSGSSLEAVVTSTLGLRAKQPRTAAPLTKKNLAVRWRVLPKQKFKNAGLTVSHSLHPVDINPRPLNPGIQKLNRP